MIARRVLFSGRVQGVGFRYTTVAIAKQFSVAGWVRNLPNGQVELQIKGGSADVDGFLKELIHNSRLSELISDTTMEAVELESIDNHVNVVVR